MVTPALFRHLLAWIDTNESGLIYFTIPREQLLLYGSSLSTAPAPQPESKYHRPTEDVTGVIDVRRQTVQLHVVLANELRFRAGCDGDRCTIDETHTGTITADIKGATLPAAPPTTSPTTAPKTAPPTANRPAALSSR